MNTQRKLDLAWLMLVVLTVGGAVEGTLDFAAELARHDGAALSFVPPAGPDHVAALFHTGGTTGLPKLAQHTHANQLYAAWGAARGNVDVEAFIAGHKWALLAGGQALFLIAGISSHFAGSALFRRA